MRVARGPHVQDGTIFESAILVRVAVNGTRMNNDVLLFFCFLYARTWPSHGRVYDSTG